MKRKPVRQLDTAAQGVRYSVLYARVSSKEQENGFSIAAQQTLLREYAKRIGLTILREFIDVETAKQSGRREFTEMMKFLAEHQEHCRTVLVEKTDRLYRNIKDWVIVEEAGAEVHLVKENVVLSEDSRSHEKLVHGFKVLMAKNYIDNLSEETSKGMLEKARQGIWPSCAPLGYRNVVGQGGKRTIEPDEACARTVSRMFEWYATGNYSLKDITVRAHKEGLRSKKGADVSKSNIDLMLRNRIYTGDFDWDGQTYRGNHAALVSRELWDRVQAVLDRRYEKRTRHVKHEFAFSGLVTCGHCGCSLVGEIKKGKYIYYHCTGYRGKCPEPYTPESELEEQFSTFVDQLTFDNDILPWLTSALRESHADEKRDHEEATAKLQAEYMRIQTRLDRMYEDKLDGKIETSFFERKAGEWRTEQHRIMQEIDRHHEANQDYIEQGVMLLELAANAGRLFRAQQPSEKRRLLNFLLSNCTWKDKTLSTTYRQPFDMIALAPRGSRKPSNRFSDGTAKTKKWLLR